MCFTALQYIFVKIVFTAVKYVLLSENAITIHTVDVLNGIMCSSIQKPLPVAET